MDAHRAEEATAAPGLREEVPAPGPFENDYLPPWEEVKKRCSQAFLDEHERFIAEKQKIVERARKRPSS